jgi:hypothetical protein
MGLAMTSRHDRSLAFGLAALLFSIYLLTFSGKYHSSDEISMLAVTDSLARRGAWDVELIRWMGLQQSSFGPDGHLYSRKGIGTSLTALPIYWLALQSNSWGNVQAAMLTNAFLTAVTGGFLFLMLRRLKYGQGIALATTMVYALATMAWPYARFLFSESLTALGLVLSAYGLMRYRDSLSQTSNTKTETAARDWVSPLLAGAGLGLALVARLNNALAGPFLGLLLLFYLYRRFGFRWRAWIRPIFLFGVPVLAALAIIAWYNWLRFGSPWTTGYLPEESFTTPFFEGLYGLTLSPGKGLFWYNPILLGALLAWPAFARRHRAEALLAGAVVVSNIAFYAPWFLWWAGHGWGPRFLVAMLPFATISLAEAIEAARSRRLLGLALGALIAASLAVQLLGVVVDFNLYLEEVYDKLGLYHPDTLFRWSYSPLLRQPRYLGAQNLDLAWARGGDLNGLALALSLVLALLASANLLRAWRRPTSWGLKLSLGTTLTAGALVCILLYAPQGDVAQVAQALEHMEQEGEVVALTNPFLTEPVQDAYDGRLYIWGLASRDEIANANIEAEASRWEVSDSLTPGEAALPAASLRLQVGDASLGFYESDGSIFDTDRLPARPVGYSNLRIGDTAELVGYSFGLASVRRGQTLPVAIYWRGLIPSGASYTIYVQAIDREDRKAGQIDALPCNGRCLTTMWRPGDVIGQRYDLPISPDAPPGEYQVIVGMYDLETGVHLPAQDSASVDPAAYHRVGTIQVTP